MLSFFRRIIYSRVGVALTFVVLLLIAVMFGLGDVAGLRGGGATGASGAIASVGSGSVSQAEVRQQVLQDFQAAQAQQPTLTLAQFIDSGGLDGTLERTISGLALEQFAQTQKMVTSKRAVDGAIASIPSLQDASGKFNQASYEQLLQARHLTDAQVRGDIARELVAQQLVAPTIGATQAPEQFVRPYAALLLEKRQGQIAFVPAKAFADGPAPTDAEVQQFYARHRERYALPERRVVRYALVDADAMKAEATPTEAEIATAYQKRHADFEPSEKRTVTQVQVLTQAGAQALADKVKGGSSIAAAAQAAGLSPRTVTDAKKADYAGQTSPAVAEAVFAAASGAVVGPVKGSVGYIVAHVDTVTKVPGRSLDEARGDLVKALTTEKTVAALGRHRDALEDAAGNHATFAEMVRDQKLSAQVTPALTAAALDPTQPATKPTPALQQIAAAAFQAQPGDDPQLVPTAQDGSFALVALDKVVPAAPRPLAEIKDQVAADTRADRAQRAARQVAGQLLAKVNGGTPLAQAASAAGHGIEAPKPIGAIRAQLNTTRGQVPPPLALLFAMNQGNARILEVPGNAGWFIVKLDAIRPGDLAKTPQALSATLSDIRRVVGREYTEQFVKAVEARVGVTRNAAAIQQLRDGLLGKDAANP